MRKVPAIAITVAAGVLLTACGTGHATTPALAGRQTIADLFPTWNAALATGDPQKVADLYASDAVLLPTVSNQVRSSRPEIVDYFTKFLTQKPQGVIEDEDIDVLDADTAINTGVYRFTLTKDGKQQQVRARYTYVYELREGKWLIVNHHSSAMPEG
jgi:uncharacterized protein (TIGR02246 family)